MLKGRIQGVDKLLTCCLGQEVIRRAVDIGLKETNQPGAARVRVVRQASKGVGRDGVAVVFGVDEYNTTPAHRNTQRNKVTNAATVKPSPSQKVDTPDPLWTNPTQWQHQVRTLPNSPTGTGTGTGTGTELCKKNTTSTEVAFPVAVTHACLAEGKRARRHRLNSRPSPNAP